MKRNELRLAVLLLLLLLALTACGGADTPAPAPEEALVEEAPAEPTEAAEDDAPRTAAAPAALTLETLPAPAFGTSFTDADGRVLYTLIGDSGADGRTWTYNKFDENNELVWWTAYEYDGDGRRVRGLTRDAAGQLLWTDEFTYYDDGAMASETRLDAVGAAESLVEYHANGSEARRVSYDPQGGSYVSEYDESGAILRETEYDAAGNVVYQQEY